MRAETVTPSVTTVPSGVGGAVGMETPQWYVALVKNNTEKATGLRLKKMGYECFVPVQQETRIWKNGRKTKIDRVVIPSVVFVYCDEPIRKEIIALPFITRYMVNNSGRTTPTGHKPLAVIPSQQIDRLKFMLGKSDVPVTFVAAPYRKGDMVRIIRGKLLGLIAEIHAIDDRHSELIVHLDGLGHARLTIDPASVEPIT